MVSTLTSYLSNVEAQSIKAQKNLETFTLFPKLPTEIQLKIWKLAVPGPRVIIVEPLSFAPKHGPALEYLDGPTNQARLDEYATRNSQFGYTTSTIPPSMLGACEASRKVFLKSHTGKIITNAPIIRFSKEHDSIFLWSRLSPWSIFPKFFAKPEPNYENTIFRNVQNLMLLHSNLEVGQPERYKRWLFRYFYGLRTLGLVYNSQRQIEDVLDEGALLKLHTPEVELDMTCTTASLYKGALLSINQNLEWIKTYLQKIYFQRTKESDPSWKEPVLKVFRIQRVAPKIEVRGNSRWGIRELRQV